MKKIITIINNNRMTTMMMTYWKVLGIIGIIIFFSIPNVHSIEIPASVDVGNDAPKIESIRTFSSYVNDSVNIPETNFNADEDEKIVYIQIKVMDPNGFRDILNHGSVKVKIVLWDGVSEETFERFGSVYKNADFESGSVLRVIYTYSFEMNDLDDSRLGTENPPLYYRIKGEVTDGEYVTTSNFSEEQNADFTYKSLSPIFDIDIDIPENKKFIEPGDLFYASVTIKKIQPSGISNIKITYQIINPNGTLMDSSQESVSINDTIHRISSFQVPMNSKEGQYKFKIIISYHGTETSSRRIFWIKYPSARSSGGGMHRITTTTIIQIVGMNISEYPKEMDLTLGETKLFLFILKNIGNTEIKNPLVSIVSPLKIVKIIPPKVDILFPGDKVIFVVEAKVPENLSVEKYELIIKAVSGFVKIEKTIILHVFPFSMENLRTRLVREIENLKNTLDYTWKKTVESGLEGKDVNVVFQMLNDAKNEITLAENNLRKQRYNKTTEHIKKARKLIEKGVNLLFKLKIPKKDIREIVSVEEKNIYVFPLIYKILIITVTITGIILFLYERANMKFAVRNIKEKAELEKLKAASTRVRI